MPGLVGMVSLKGERVDLNLMQAMHGAIRHRDWYKIEDYVSPRGTVAISRVHLGIINRDEQPYRARDGRVKVFLHGEIYDDQVVDSNEVEFVYRLYERKGSGFASSLNGSFIIVIVDEEEDSVLIANDRIATKPLFCFNDDRTIYFDPEMKSLFVTPSLARKLNLAAVADSLVNGYFIREHTLIDGLETVDSATVLKVAPGGVTRHRYWEPPLKYGSRMEGKERDGRYYQEQLDELLRKAISRRLRSGNTYGILLSRGYDSRGILGYYLQETHADKLHTISWGREENIPDSDCAAASRPADKLNADHRFYKLTAEEVFDNFYEFVGLGEGVTWFAESYEVFHRIRERQGVDIVLRGDEWLGSKAALVHDEHTMFRVLNVRALRHIREYQRVLKPHYYRMFCELDAETSRHVSSTCSASNIRDRKDFFASDVELKHYLNPLNYVKTFALESFTPLLGFDVLDFVSTLPVKHRLDKTLYRRTVLERSPELFEEVAETHNMIDWVASFRDSPELKHFIYRELIQEQNAFTEFMDTSGLENELDAFFVPRCAPSTRTGAKRKATKLLGKSPTAYNLAHKCSYYVRKRTGRVRDILPMEQLMIRLLILKVWGNVFLDYPVVNAPRQIRCSGRDGDDH